MKKGLRNSEGLYIHDGGDEGDRTPDLLTASQALSQLSYAPVTRRYYRGMFAGMQEIFWGCCPTSRVFLGRRIKPSRQQIADRNALMNLDLGRTPNDIGDAGVSQ